MPARRRLLCIHASWLRRRRESSGMVLRRPDWPRQHRGSALPAQALIFRHPRWAHGKWMSGIGRGWKPGPVKDGKTPFSWSTPVEPVVGTEENDRLIPPAEMADVFRMACQGLESALLFW